VRYVPSGYYAVPPPNALVVQAGDPRLGGILCGNCKGTGRVSVLIFDDHCPVYLSLLLILLSLGVMVLEGYGSHFQDKAVEIVKIPLAHSNFKM
jgi:hypothetical protein